MRGFKDILVAVDFSPGTHRVLELATRVLQVGGRLHLIHVVEWIPGVVEGTLVGFSHPSHVRALHAASERQLALCVAGCAGILTSTEVVEGHPARSILETAERRGSDLIVVGAVRQPGLARSRLGPVAERVLRRACCPVLVARP